MMNIYTKSDIFKGKDGLRGLCMTVCPTSINVNTGCIFMIATRSILTDTKSGSK